MVDVRIDATLADELQLVEAFEQWSSNLRPLADQDQDFGFSQPFRERVEILHAVVPDGDFVACKLLETGQGAQRIVIVVEDGDLHCGRVLRRSRTARPDGLTPTIHRPLMSSRVTSPRSLASSQTGSFGQDVRHASITSS
jgi:hypothetical protein